MMQSWICVDKMSKVPADEEIMTFMFRPLQKQSSMVYGLM